MKTLREYLSEITGINKKASLKLYWDAGFDSDDAIKRAEKSLVKIKQVSKGYWKPEDIKSDIKKLSKG